MSSFYTWPLWQRTVTSGLTLTGNATSENRVPDPQGDSDCIDDFGQDLLVYGVGGCFIL